jgi:hypothetical protein
MILSELTFSFSQVQKRILSGGITCNGLKIQEISVAGKAKELIITGDVTITLKVLKLTTHGTPKLTNLMKHTQQNITSKLKGETIDYSVYLADYNSKSNKFNKNIPATYNLRYKINYLVRVEQIRTLSQLSGNDFVLAVVDHIGLKVDKYKISGLTTHNDVPATVSYDGWCIYPNIGTHEFFHTLGLSDLRGQANRNRLMYEIASKTNNQVSTQELLQMNRYLMYELVDMSGGRYTNQTLNTVNKLRSFLNNPINGFKYNKAKFR